MDEIIWTDYDGLSDEDLDENLRGLTFSELVDHIAELDDEMLLTVEALHG